MADNIDSEIVGCVVLLQCFIKFWKRCYISTRILCFHGCSAAINSLITSKLFIMFWFLPWSFLSKEFRASTISTRSKCHLYELKRVRSFQGKAPLHFAVHKHEWAYFLLATSGYPYNKKSWSIFTSWQSCVNSLVFSVVTFTKFTTLILAVNEAWSTAGRGFAASDSQ